MIRLVIPDSGPLIFLAKIDRLDLLDRIKCPITIIDVVKIEVLDGPSDVNDVQVLEKWFEQGKNRI